MAVAARAVLINRAVIAGRRIVVAASHFISLKKWFSL
jgi:hypothetical protein